MWGGGWYCEAFQWPSFNWPSLFPTISMISRLFQNCLGSGLIWKTLILAYDFQMLLNRLLKPVYMNLIQTSFFKHLIPFYADLRANKNSSSYPVEIISTYSIIIQQKKLILKVRYRKILLIRSAQSTNMMTLYSGGLYTGILYSGGKTLQFVIC